jgi:hypothetical protein
MTVSSGNKFAVNNMYNTNYTKILSTQATCLILFIFKPLVSGQEPTHDKAQITSDTLLSN